MDETIVEVPLVYKATGILPRHRKVSDAIFVGSTAVAIANVPADKARVVGIVSDPYWHGGAAVTYRVVNGCLMRPLAVCAPVDRESRRAILDPTAQPGTSKCLYQRRNVAPPTDLTQVALAAAFAALRNRWLAESRDGVFVPANDWWATRDGPKTQGCAKAIAENDSPFREMIESTFEAEVERTRKAVRGMAFVEGILHGATSVPAWVVEGRVVRQRRHMDGVRYEPVASVEPLAGASAMQRLCAYLPSFAREAVQEANLITSVEGRLGGAALRQGAELVGSIEVIDAQAMTPPPCKERRQLLEASDTLRKLVASGIDGLDRRLAEVTHLLRQNEQLWLEERGKMMCLARAIEAQVSCHTDAAARFPDA